MSVDDGNVRLWSSEGERGEKVVREMVVERRLVEVDVERLQREQVVSASAKRADRSRAECMLPLLVATHLVVVLQQVSSDLCRITVKARSSVNAGCARPWHGLEAHVRIRVDYSISV